MERGELVPDEVTVGMLLERLAAPDAARGVILDGFPRTRSQAEALDRALADRGGRGGGRAPRRRPRRRAAAAAHRALALRGRRPHFHETAYPPRVPGICDICGSRLIQRDDDRPEVVQARLEKQLGALARRGRPLPGRRRAPDGRRPPADRRGHERPARLHRARSRTGERTRDHPQVGRRDRHDAPRRPRRRRGPRPRGGGAAAGRLDRAPRRARRGAHPEGRARRPRSRATTGSRPRSASRSTARSSTGSPATA